MKIKGLGLREVRVDAHCPPDEEYRRAEGEITQGRGRIKGRGKVLSIVKIFDILAKNK